MLSRYRFCWLFCPALLSPLAPALWAQQGKLDPVQRTAVQEVDQRSEELKAVNRQVWELAEVGLEERQSSQLLIGKLKAAGFQVKSGLSGMPTAFVASYGSGKPVIGILAEYDALARDVTTGCSSS